MASIEERVEELVKPSIESLGYNLYDVIYAKEGKDYFLRIFIDSENGIDINDCEKVNNAITDMLDEANYIKDQYFLEVSSPGIERIIRKDSQLEQNIGEIVSIRLFKSQGNTKEIIGELKSYNESTIEVIEDGKNQTIDRKNISIMKKYYNWQ